MIIKSVRFNRTIFPPELTLSVHGAPHRRQEDEVLIEYRKKLVAACLSVGMRIPYEDVVDVNLLMVDPTTPDLDNLLTAFYRAVDAKALEGPSILADDGLIQKITIMKFYPNPPSKYENRIPSRYDRDE